MKLIEIKLENTLVLSGELKTEDPDRVFIDDVFIGHITAYKDSDQYHATSASKGSTVTCDSYETAILYCLNPAEETNAYSVTIINAGAELTLDDLII